MSEEVNLWYVVKNLGDGSVGVYFHNDQKSAIKDEEDEEEPFGESSVNKVTLKIIDGSIHRKVRVWDSKSWVTQWIKLV